MANKSEQAPQEWHFIFTLTADELNELLYGKYIFAAFHVMTDISYSEVCMYTYCLDIITGANPRA